MDSSPDSPREAGAESADAERLQHPGSSQFQGGRTPLGARSNQSARPSPAVHAKNNKTNPGCADQSQEAHVLAKSVASSSQPQEADEVEGANVHVSESPPLQPRDFPPFGAWHPNCASKTVGMDAAGSSTRWANRLSGSNLPPPLLAFPCSPHSNNPYWRDWANLAHGPAELIAERVLAYDVADYVRFRAVCRPWMECSSDPRTHGGLDRRFHPWRWTMLQEELAAPDCRCFLNTSTGQCIKVDIPELSNHLLLAVTPEGLLVLKTQRATVRLLNPLTRHLIELPRLTTLVPPKHHSMLSEPDWKFAAWGSGIANDDSTVVLCFDKLYMIGLNMIGLNMIGLAKPGDDSWKLVKYHSGLTAAPLMFAGRFYFVHLSGDVLVLETGADHPPQFKVAAKLRKRVSEITDSVHLVNNCGELMLVHRWSAKPRSKYWSRYDAYRVGLDTGKLYPVKSLGGAAGRAMFMGKDYSLSVPLEVFPSGSISADTIYLRFNVPERFMKNTGAYHLASGRAQLPCSLVEQPHTLIDCLSLSNTV